MNAAVTVGNKVVSGAAAHAVFSLIAVENVPAYIAADDVGRIENTRTQLLAGHV